MTEFMKLLTSKFLSPLVATSIAILVPLVTKADIVIKPVSITLSGAVNGQVEEGTYSELALINGSGLSLPLNTGDLLLPATHNWKTPSPLHITEIWSSTAPGGEPSDWFAVSSTKPTFVLDLGANYDVDTIHLWASGGSVGFATGIQGNSAKSLEFRFNSEAQGFGSFDGSPFAVQMDHGPDKTVPEGSIIPRQDFPVTSDVFARYIQMVITDNWAQPTYFGSNDEHGHMVAGGDRVALSEVRFSTIPEPGSAGLLLIGASIILRRNRRR
jgi:hypothetical protein